MKFNAKQMSNGNWAVFCGPNKFFTKTENPDEEWVLNEACKRTAMWHLEKAREAVKLMDNVDMAVMVGHAAMEVENDVQEIWEDSEHFDQFDPSGWKA